MAETGKVRLLVVDDDEAIRTFLGHLLESEGYEVELAENGSVALEKIAAQPFDLVITDIAMPEKDGIETIISVRDSNPSTKIIAISGVEKNERLLEIAQMYKADASLKKPFDNDVLLETIKKVLGGGSG